MFSYRLDKSRDSQVRQSVQYSSSQKGQNPTITLVDDISSWHVGDKIVIASTGYDARDSEVFTITAKIGRNQLRLDRPADHTHWGRIDSVTGIDQRAEVGLLSRNVRFYGEMSFHRCRKAVTREALVQGSHSYFCYVKKNQNCCAFKHIKLLA